MHNQLVDVDHKGAICLGRHVVCDGFANEFPFRIQTHVHDDHMSNFHKSKGLQDVVMTPETFDLLVAYFNADIPFRNNFIKIEHGEERKLCDGTTVQLLSSNHMLGACQVALELPDGCTVGYSGDFGWPIDEIIQVEQLVVDSTYGSPRSVRNFTQAEAEDCLLQLVCDRLKHGPVHIKAFRGTIERVLHSIFGGISVPIYASDRLIREIEVYQRYGFATGILHPKKSVVSRELNRYVQLYSKGDSFPNELVSGTTINCSAYMTKSDNPLIKFSDRAYAVGLSNHADFQETLAYVEATGATHVVTDNTRSHGVELAIEINNRLTGVFAQPSNCIM